MKKQTRHVLSICLAVTVIFQVGIQEAKANWPIKRKLNPVHMVVVFTKFKGEAPNSNTAPSWAGQMFSGAPGSVPHFFDKVSFGNYRITGQFLPKRYELPGAAEDYIEVREDGRIISMRDKYAKDILELLDNDPDVDFSKFDRDGPDGIPGSSDDDNYVDYMVFMPMSRPFGFISNYATGVWTNGLKEDYTTEDKSSDGFTIKLDKWSGCIATANSLTEAVGTIIAEIAHAFGSGALDLMDKSFTDNSDDSAGVGFWDFLGKGALGWNYKNGPMGPSAFNRMRMESVGPFNSQLVDLFGFQQGIGISDVGKEHGKTYKVSFSPTEYFLIEYRRNDSLYYDRFIPQNGLLIWHILYGETNDQELIKLCDLECPDGRYIDAGYPLGKKPDPLNGGDNLDFWSHDLMHNVRYEGNAGDSFDVFDGVKYTQFGSETNPNSYSKVTLKKTGIEIFNIRVSADGDSMLFDCIIPPFHNWFEEKYPWIGSAFQRFTLTTMSGNAKSADKGVYLIRSGVNKKPATMVTIGDDEMKLESLSTLAGYEIDSFLAQRLMTTDYDLRDSRIVRDIIPLDHFESIISDFGVELNEIGRNGTPTMVQKISRLSSGDTRPVTISLYQNSPNPFNSSTSIQYMLPANGNVEFEIYNVLGQKLLDIDRGYQSMGMHTYRFDAGDFSSGIYLYRLKSNTMSQTKKFTLIR